MKLFDSWIYKGNITTKVRSIIPVLMQYSRSKITEKGYRGHINVRSLHITPWFTISLNWMSK